jgi:hypothetical protein
MSPALFSLNGRKRRSWLVSLSVKTCMQRVMFFSSVLKLKTSVDMVVLPGCRKKTELDS